MTCEQARMSLGVYVLGALDPAEDRAVERHIDRCPTCRAELTELEDLPLLLRRVSLPGVAEEQPATGQIRRDDDMASLGQPEPSAELLDRLLRRAALERSAVPHPPTRLRPSRRRRWGAVAAGLVVAAALLGVVLGIVAPPKAPSARTAVVAATDPVTHVGVQVDLQPQDWGTLLRVRMQGVAPGQSCQLMAVDRYGHQEVAATWQATYEGHADVTGATAIPASALRALRVVTPEGRTLVTAAVPH
jgi:hypothetical protein